VVGITGLIEADDRMDEDIGTCVARRLHHHCLLSPMDGAMGLKGEHLLPAEIRKKLTGFSGCSTELWVVVVDWQLKGLDATGNCPPSSAVKVLGDACVRPVGGAEDCLDFGFEIALVTLVDLQRGDHHPFSIPKGEKVTAGEVVGELVRNIEGHRHRPENAIAETHLRAHRLMVRSAEVAVEGRVSAVDQEFEVAELARTEVDRGPVSGLFANLGGAILTDHEVDQTRSVRTDEVIQCSGSQAHFGL
jgi:hypothetical protein